MASSVSHLLSNAFLYLRENRDEIIPFTTLKPSSSNILPWEKKKAKVPHILKGYPLDCWMYECMHLLTFFSLFLLFFSLFLLFSVQCMKFYVRYFYLKRRGKSTDRSLYIFRNNKRTYLAKEKDKTVENVRKCYCFYFVKVQICVLKIPITFPEIHTHLIPLQKMVSKEVYYSNLKND